MTESSNTKLISFQVKILDVEALLILDSFQKLVTIAPAIKKTGCLAQMVERLPYTQNVGGSIPSAPTINAGLFLIF
jgi:hypothetical protein